MGRLCRIPFHTVVIIHHDATTFLWRRIQGTARLSACYHSNILNSIQVEKESHLCIAVYIYQT